jgi:hypothetical protein
MFLINYYYLITDSRVVKQIIPKCILKNMKDNEKRGEYKPCNHDGPCNDKPGYLFLLVLTLLLYAFLVGF